jgi:hypothetical protein
MNLSRVVELRETSRWRFVGSVCWVGWTAKKV